MEQGFSKSYKNAISIIDEIKKEGDVALLRFIEKFDNVKIDSFAVTEKRGKRSLPKRDFKPDRHHKVYEIKGGEKPAAHNEQP